MVKKSLFFLLAFWSLLDVVFANRCGYIFELLGQPSHKRPVAVIEKSSGYEILHSVDGTVKSVQAKGKPELEEFLSILRRSNVSKNINSGVRNTSRSADKSSVDIYTLTPAPAPAPHADQFKKFVRDPSNWQTERRALHEQIVAQQLAATQILSTHLSKSKLAERFEGSPILVLMRGNSASGKSSTLKKGRSPLLDQMGAKNFLDDLILGSINPDSVKYVLQSQSQGMNSSQVHEEGSMLANRMIEASFEQNLSFVVDKRFVELASIKTLVEEAHKRSYKVVMIDVDADLENSTLRILKRIPGKEAPNVPFSAIKEGFEKVRKDRRSIVDSNLLDAYELLSTDTAVPTLIATQLPKQAFEIRDAKLWKMATSFEPAAVHSVQDNLSHVVDVLSTVDPESYQFSQSILDQLPPVIHYDVPRAQSIVESLVQEMGKEEMPIIYWRRADPRYPYVKLPKTVQGKYDEMRTLSFVHLAVRDSIYEIRKGGGIRDHTILAVALRDHFFTSYPHSQVILEEQKDGYRIEVRGLSLADQHRILGDLFWRAKYEGENTVVFYTKEFSYNYTGAMVEVEDIHLPGLGPNTTDHPKLHPAYVLNKRKNDWAYADELFSRPAVQRGQLSEKEPLLVSVEISHGSNAHFDFKYKAENLAFSNGFRIDEAEAYLVSAEMAFGYSQSYAKEQHFGSVNSPQVVAYSSLKKTQIQNARRQAEIAQHFAVHALDILNQLLDQKIQPEKFASSSKPVNYTDFRMSLLRLKDVFFGKKAEVPYTNFNARLAADPYRQIQFNTQQMVQRYGPEWEGHLPQEIKKLRDNMSQLLKRAVALIEECDAS